MGKSYAAEIRAACAERGITQDDAARDMTHFAKYRVSFSTLQTWLGGRHPNASHAHMLDGWLAKGG